MNKISGRPMEAKPDNLKKRGKIKEEMKMNRGRHFKSVVAFLLKHEST
jgi:hypothetical protein